MRLYKIYFLIILFGLFGFAGCGYEFPTQPVKEDPVSENRSKFERFVVIGGDITSGLMDGALYSKGQHVAYPNLIGSRLDSVFKQDIYGIAEINSSNGYNANVSTSTTVGGRFKLLYRSPESTFPARIAVAGEAITPFGGTIDTVNNFSIPALRSYQIANRDSLSDNVYFGRFSNQVANKSLLELALSKNPTLLLLSVGIGDTYPYALNGAGGRINPPWDDINSMDATPLSLFEQTVRDLVKQVLNNSRADIILPTIINPVDFFYFNTLNWKFSDSEIEGQVSNARQHYELFNEQVQEFNFSNSGQKYRPTIIWGYDTYNAKVFVDDLLPYAETDEGTVIPKYRQMKHGEKLLYSVEQKQYSSLNGDKSFATTDPAADKAVISGDELEVINNMFRSYNEVLRSIAESEARVHLLDLDSTMKAVSKNKEVFNGVRFNVGFDQNTLISADGYFPNKKGQALFANKLLELFNREYGTRFSPFDVNSFEGNITEIGF